MTNHKATPNNPTTVKLEAELAKLEKALLEFEQATENFGKLCAEALMPNLDISQMSFDERMGVLNGRIGLVAPYTEMYAGYQMSITQLKATLNVTLDRLTLDNPS